MCACISGAVASLARVPWHGNRADLCQSSCLVHNRHTCAHAYMYAFVHRTPSQPSMPHCLRTLGVRTAADYNSTAPSVIVRR